MRHLHLMLHTTGFTLIAWLLVAAQASIGTVNCRAADRDQSTVERREEKHGIQAGTAASRNNPKSNVAKNVRREQRRQKAQGNPVNANDGRNRDSGKRDPPLDPEFAQYGIYHESAPRAERVEPRSTQLPLTITRGDRIALVGNTLFERLALFGHLEAMLQQRYPDHELIVRNLAWSGDTPALQPRPANFADIDQHLTHERADIVFAAFGFNESFAGAAGKAAFHSDLSEYIARLRSSAFNGTAPPQVVLVSPIANENASGVNISGENASGVNAADLNNERIRMYVDVVRQVAAEQHVGFVDAYSATQAIMDDPETNRTLNGSHMTEAAYETFARTVFRSVTGEDASAVNPELRAVIIDKNRQYFRRYRPLNTFYYTGDRSRDYGYLDFLPAMRNFDVMVANRERRIHDIVQSRIADAAQPIDDSNVPKLPETKQSRGANRWITADQELAEFKVDPRFEVNLFAGEEEFPDIAAPIQMRWDARGRLWVSCSTTYPHVYPGNEPNDKLVILEDTNGDGRADTSTVFADDLHIPLSFEFGDGGVYVSEMPHLTFLQDTDGDGKADSRRHLLAGFGTEDSHHALHDFTWTPDGALLFRESIFHHSQIETPYGPVRQQNSGWFRFEPRSHRLTSFGTYHSTNPWGVTFDDWGQHVASHPIYAAAFHAPDPPYPQQHPKPVGLQAYSGTCGHEFVDFPTFPDELQGGFIKARYKPTNRIEIHKWNESPFGYDEEYVSDLIFSTNLSFIPVDIRFGPRGAMYVCDWYNPIKGHAQYSLRDERRDRHSGRIWRITAKDRKLQELPKIADASIPELLDLLKRPEYRYRYWAKRELRERDADQVLSAVDAWFEHLSPEDDRYHHHQVEAIWACRTVGGVRPDWLREVLVCDDHHARAAATQQLRYWHTAMPDAVEWLRRSANDPNGIVRMEAAIAASYIGTRESLVALLETLNHPRDGHLAYAIQCALGSQTLKRHWEHNPEFNVERLLQQASREGQLKEPAPTAAEAQFDAQPELAKMDISCVPERMRFTVDQFAVTTGQPVKVVFSNPDATDHNLVFVRPNALAEVGMAANAMARDPQHANSDFIPEDKADLILHASPMIGPTRKTQVHVLRFVAPDQPGIYPFVCTFPGHWVIMTGDMIVADDPAEVERMLAERQPRLVKEWTLSDFPQLTTSTDEESVMRGMQAFTRGRCNQCHVVSGHGTNLGPDLTDIAKRMTGQKLLEQILTPSVEINPKYKTTRFLLTSGKVIAGVVVAESDDAYQILTNLLTPDLKTAIPKADVDEQFPSPISPMPAGMANVLTRPEIIDLMSFLEAGGYQLPDHLKHKHGTGH